MKRLLTAVLTVLVSSWSTQSQVTMYEHPNYSGKAIAFEEGSISRLRNTDVGNDRISSIRVPAGYVVLLYEDDYFNGRSWTYSKSVSKLPDGVNDKASSIVVKKSGGSGWGGSGGSGGSGGWGWSGSSVKLYEECYYKGRSIDLKEGSYASMPSGFNNRLSSLRVPAGYEVMLYNSTNFQGKYTRLQSDEWCIPSSWNNATSSMRIYKSGGGSFPDGFDPWDENNFGEGDWNNGNFDRDQIRIYEQCNYRGVNVPYRVGNYSTIPTAFRGKVASVKVPSGYEAVFYSGTNFSGESYTLGSDNTCLPADVKTRARSLRVARSGSGFGGSGGSGGGFGGSGGSGGSGGFGGSGGSGESGGSGSSVVIAYPNCNFTGEGLKLQLGEFPTLPSNVSNRISSIRINPGYVVRVYQGENFRGPYKEFTSSQTCLTKPWNQTLGSMRIRRK